MGQILIFCNDIKIAVVSAVEAMNYNYIPAAAGQGEQSNMPGRFTDPVLDIIFNIFNNKDH